MLNDPSILNPCPKCHSLRQSMLPLLTALPRGEGAAQPGEASHKAISRSLASWRGRPLRDDEYLLVKRLLHWLTLCEHHKVRGIQQTLPTAP
jgi:hypothetical protein